MRRDAENGTRHANQRGEQNRNRRATGTRKRGAGTPLCERSTARYATRGLPSSPRGDSRAPRQTRAA
eukprot:11215875-Lingulodinium_polyedra.AAC.1